MIIILKIHQKLLQNERNKLLRDVMKLTKQVKLAVTKPNAENIKLSKIYKLYQIQK